MMTSEGIRHVKRYMAGWVPSIAQSMAFGVGQTTATTDDTQLQFEIGRADVELTTYDFEQDKLVFKTTLPENFEGTIYEVALYSAASNSFAGEYGSRLLFSFDSETEEWLQGANPADYLDTNTRIGVDSLRVTAAANGSVTVSTGDTVIDLGGYSAADQFSFAFYNENTNLSSLRFRFKTDASNYYDVTVPSASIVQGFNIVKINKGNAVATGSPNWAMITGLDVTANAKATGTFYVNLEGIRIEDTDTASPDYVLISRVVLPVPFEKRSGRMQEVEFPLGVSVSG